MAPRWQAAWWPKMSRGGAMSGSEHGSTLASSVVAGIREVISATVATGVRRGSFDLAETAGQRFRTLRVPAWCTHLDDRPPDFFYFFFM